jgi:starch synthase (maltosyl-transferring)
VAEPFVDDVAVVSRSTRLDLSFRRRVVIEHVQPAVDEGRFAVKRTSGEIVEVAADIFADGHDVLAAVVRDRIAVSGESDETLRETRMRLVAPGADRWTASFDVGPPGW